MSLEELRKVVARNVETELRASSGLYDGKHQQRPRPLWIKPLVAGADEELPDVVVRWHRRAAEADSEHPPIAILSAQLGAGKTIATCTTQRALADELNKRGEDRVAVWMSARSLGDGLRPADLNPERLIPGLLGVTSGVPADGIACVILDGVDEHLARAGDPESLLTTLTDVLRQLRVMRVPVLLSGRDVVLGDGPIYRRLRDVADTLCPYDKALRIELRSWTHRELRPILQRQLATCLSDEQWAAHLQRTGHATEAHAVEALGAMIKDDVLSSPLLFGLAYEVLRGWLRGHSRIRERLKRIDTPWELTDLWVERCIERDGWRFAARTTPELRRQVARRLALYLAVSGEGMRGVSLERLQDPEMHWIWDLLEEGPVDPNAVPDGVHHRALRMRAPELVHGCLLARRDDRFAPFHQHVLAHLAAEAMEALARREDAVSPNSSGRSSPLRLDPWVEIGGHLGFATPERLGEAIARYIGGAALRRGSVLEETLSYWARACLTGKKAPPVRLQDYYRELVPERGTPENARGRRIIGAAVRFVEALEPPDPAPPAGREIEVGGARYRELPAGTRLLWGVDEKGDPILIEHTLYMPFFLGVQLVTVKSFMGLKPPGPPPPPGSPPPPPLPLSDDPVSGVSWQDAQAYPTWLTADLEGRGGMPAEALGGFELPTTEHFAIAVTGPDLRRTAWNGPGPYGHEDLLVRRWQHTAGPASMMGADGQANIAQFPGVHQSESFGGSDRLGGSGEAPSGDEKDAARERAWEQLQENSIRLVQRVRADTRLADHGIRVGFSAAAEIVRTTFEEKLTVRAGGMSAAAPDPGNDDLVREGLPELQIELVHGAPPARDGDAASKSAIEAVHKGLTGGLVTAGAPDPGDDDDARRGLAGAAMGPPALDAHASVAPIASLTVAFYDGSALAFANEQVIESVAPDVTVAELVRASFGAWSAAAGGDEDAEPPVFLLICEAASGARHLVSQGMTVAAARLAAGDRLRCADTSRLRALYGDELVLRDDAMCARLAELSVPLGLDPATSAALVITRLAEQGRLADLTVLAALRWPEEAWTRAALRELVPVGPPEVVAPFAARSFTAKDRETLESLWEKLSPAKRAPIEAAAVAARELTSKELSDIGDRLLWLAGDVSVADAVTQVNDEKNLRPAAWKQRSWHDLVREVHKGKSTKLGQHGEAVAKLIDVFRENWPANTELRELAERLRRGEGA